MGPTVVAVGLADAHMWLDSRSFLLSVTEHQALFSLLKQCEPRWWGSHTNGNMRFLHMSDWNRKHGEMDAGAQIAFPLSPFYSVHNPRPWDGAGWGPFHIVKPPPRHPHRHNQRCASLMPKRLLNSIKWTIEFNPYRAVPSSREVCLLENR